MTDPLAGTGLSLEQRDEAILAVVDDMDAWGARRAPQVLARPVGIFDIKRLAAEVEGEFLSVWMRRTGTNILPAAVWRVYIEQGVLKFDAPDWFRLRAEEAYQRRRELEPALGGALAPEGPGPHAPTLGG
jgi:hypothetical protein